MLVICVSWGSSFFQVFRLFFELGHLLVAEFLYILDNRFLKDIITSFPFCRLFFTFLILSFDAKSLYVCVLLIFFLGHSTWLVGS